MRNTARKGVQDFNSHAHVERDLFKHCFLLLSGISTHTLTWSVTARPAYPNRLSIYFNSHAHVERDKPARLWSHNAGNFNSHAHVERDRSPCHSLSVTSYFNSHAHVERDRTTLRIRFLFGSFQLTRSRGA